MKPRKVRGGFGKVQKGRVMNITRRLILPPEAQSILDRMVGNRARRQKHVEVMAADMREGRWVDTHEPIAMSVDGNLIDGQHRLAAVVLSGVGQWFWVAVYDTHQTAIGLPIDCGARRSMADLLGIDRKITEAAGAMLRYAILPLHGSPRADQVSRVIELCKTELEEAIDCSHGNKRIKGSGVARAAIVINLLRYKSQKSDILAEFKRWNMADNLTWASVMALNKQLDYTRGIRLDAAFLRIVRAFEPTQKHKDVLRLNTKEAAILLEQIREDLVTRLFPEGTK